jgi:methionyl-tRNA synthetase
MAAGLPVPKAIVAHGWLLFEESKMSKSRGNIVRTETILDVLGADALRYFLLREVVFGQDGSFSFDALVQRYNSDLANGLGNLASRTLTMINRYFKGEVPLPVAWGVENRCGRCHRRRGAEGDPRIWDSVRSVPIFTRSRSGVGTRGDGRQVHC